MTVPSEIAKTSIAPSTMGSAMAALLAQSETGSAENSCHGRGIGAIGVRSYPSCEGIPSHGEG